MNHTRRNAFKLAAVALAIAGIGVAVQAHADDDYDSLREGKVVTSTNASSVNELLIYAPSRRGLEQVQRVSTQGREPEPVWGRREPLPSAAVVAMRSRLTRLVTRSPRLRSAETASPWPRS